MRKEPQRKWSWLSQTYSRKKNAVPTSSSSKENNGCTVLSSFNTGSEQRWVSAKYK